MSPHDNGMQTPHTEFGTGTMWLLKLQCGLSPVSVHQLTVLEAREGPPLSSVQVSAWLGGESSVLHVFWFGQDLHLLPSITPVPESPLQPSRRSFPKEDKERSELKQAKMSV